jgi:hypothetical protein
MRIDEQDPNGAELKQLVKDCTNPQVNLLAN